jgi:hypothetical protein
MKMTRVLIAAALLLVPAATRAQTIEGVVVDDSTRNPIAGVRVELTATAGARSSARTDSTGVFRFDSVAGGGAILRFRHPSYTPVDSLAVQVSRGERVEIELRMGHSAVLLEPIVVRARADEGLGGFRDRMRVGAFGRFVSREQIDRGGSLRASELVRMLPGVQIVQGAPGNSLIVMRGGGTGTCIPDVYVDGSRLRQTREVGVDAFLNPAILEGVEVYTSSATVPGIFATTNQCGVVAFWTRPSPPGRWSWKRLFVGVGVFALLILLAR